MSAGLIQHELSFCGKFVFPCLAFLRERTHDEHAAAKETGCLKAAVGLRPRPAKPAIGTPTCVQCLYKDSRDADDAPTSLDCGSDDAKFYRGTSAGDVGRSTRRRAAR